MKNKFKSLFHQANGKPMEDDKLVEFPLGAGFLDDKDQYGLDIAIVYDDNDQPHLAQPYKFTAEKVNFGAVSDELLNDYHLENGLQDLLQNPLARSFTFTGGVPVLGEPDNYKYDVVYLTTGNIDLYDHYRFYDLNPDTVVTRLVFQTTSLRSLMVNYNQDDFNRALPDISNDLVYAWDLGIDVSDRANSDRAKRALSYLGDYLSTNISKVLYDESLIVNAQLADYKALKQLEKLKH